VTSPVQFSQPHTVVIPSLLQDGESLPIIRVVEAPLYGGAYFTGGTLRYSPYPSFTCSDHFIVEAWDGVFASPSRMVQILRIEGDDWQDLVSDIFQPRCQDCHLNGNTEGGLSLDTYASAQAGGLSGLPGFTPFQPSNSQIYLRTVNGDMPMGGTPLSSEELGRIFDWIANGAPEHNICP